MHRSGRPTRQDNIDTTDVGWRLHQLRIRRGLRQNELAQLAGLDAAYLNRLEKGSTRKAKPKLETINKILDALCATPLERSAVLRIESPPPTSHEIGAIVAEVRARYEDDPLPVTLLDEHWVRWYHNYTMRSILALNDEEYRRTMGELPLYSLIDPTSPTYHRIPDDERMQSFATRSMIFKRQFAAQEFDTWYLEIASKVREFPEAAEIWDNPPPLGAQQFLDSHDASIYSPVLCRKLFLKTQLNRLMADPRFVLVQFSPMEEETAQIVEQLRSAPKFTGLLPGTFDLRSQEK